MGWWCKYSVCNIQQIHLCKDQLNDRTYLRKFFFYFLNILLAHLSFYDWFLHNEIIVYYSIYTLVLVARRCSEGKCVLWV